MDKQTNGIDFIYPYHSFRRYWEYFIYLVSFTVFWEIPYEWCVQIDHNITYIIITLIFDLVYLIDIYIQNMTGVWQYGVVLMDQHYIELQIPLWRKIIYWLSPIPYSLIGMIFSSYQIFSFILILKAIRIIRLFDAHKLIRNTLIYISPISKIGSLIITLLTIIHISACLFLKVGKSAPLNSSWLFHAQIHDKPISIQYFISYYYIVVTVLSIGYGDLHPCSISEISIVIFIELIGVFFYNFLVSTLVSIIADPSRNSFLSKYQRVYNAFKWRGISDDSMSELLRYYEYLWEKERGQVEFYDTMSKMPEGLQKRIALALDIDLFNKYESLRNASPDVLEYVALLLKPRVFTPGDFLVKSNRISSKMYILTEGKASIINSRGLCVGSVDGMNGSIIGEASFVQNIKEPASVVAETYLEAFELSKKDYNRIIEKYPSFQENLIHHSSV